MPRPKRSITRAIRTRRPLHPARERDELDALTWPEAIRVGERMTRPAVTIEADAPVSQAADLMRRRKLRHLPVVDRAGRLVGIVTDRDLRQVVFDPAVQERLGAAAEGLTTLPVREVMTWGAITVSPLTEIRDAARIMREHKVGALPVVEGRKVVGILTETDVLRTFSDVLNTALLAKPYRWAFGYR